MGNDKIFVLRSLKNVVLLTWASICVWAIWLCCTVNIFYNFDSEEQYSFAGLSGEKKKIVEILSKR